MHIPDGFINNGVSTSLLGAAAALVGIAVSKVRAAFLQKVPVLKQKLATFPNINDGSEISYKTALSKFGKEKMWRMATIGAFIFAAQMINFPIAEGTSGHLLGGALAALILGPWEGLLVITAVLGIQAFMFGDGGIIALGANVVNMGCIGTLGSWVIFTFIYKLTKNNKRFFIIIAVITAWLSVVLASVGASFELALSGTKALTTVLPAMATTHMLIGLGEAVITAAVLAALLAKKQPLAILNRNTQNNEK